jgi:DNA-directed RNA polymerase subunit RPC12/RpoP
MIQPKPLFVNGKYIFSYRKNVGGMLYCTRKNPPEPEGVVSLEKISDVLEYKCPCCNAGLIFDNDTQQLTCQYCDNTFDIQTVRAYNDNHAETSQEEFIWEDNPKQEWNQKEQQSMRLFQCPSCGAQLITDDNTAATFCPYCDNPTILPARLSGGLKPDSVIPFQTNKEDAQAAFLKLCKGKPLLPREFTTQQRLEKITGMYVPFWLYDCSADFDGSYKATRIHRWSDSKYNYIKTDHFLLRRGASAAFAGIPMDGSIKMDDTFMESIEPYDYSQLTEFDTAYLSGYLADKYDVPSENGKDRIRQRVDRSIEEQLQSSFLGYATVLNTGKRLLIDHSKARYVLLPVWMLNTRYGDKTYTFAMNGQTGKMTGSFPICPKRSALWFAGISVGVTLLAMLVQLM